MLRVCVGIVMIALLMVGCAKKEEAQPVMEFPEMVNTDIGTQTNLVLMGSQNKAVSAAGAAATSLPQATALQPGSAPISNPTNEDIQQALKNANLYTGKIDGEIGPKTKKAIRTFQEQNGLKADGKVGPKTWVKMQPFLSAPVAVDFNPEELGE